MEYGIRGGQCLHISKKISVYHADVQIQRFHESEHCIKADFSITDIYDLFDVRRNELSLCRSDCDCEIIIDAGVCQLPVIGDHVNVTDAHFKKTVDRIHCSAVRVVYDQNICPCRYI